jgi:hypothetical protein
MINPAMASLASFSSKKSDNYDPNWKIAFIIAPNPLLMYFTPQVLKPLLKAKFKMLKIIIVFHCLPLGKGSFSSESKPHIIVHLLVA